MITAYPYPWNANDEMYGEPVAPCRKCGTIVRRKAGIVGVGMNGEAGWWHPNCWRAEIAADS